MVSKNRAITGTFGVFLQIRASRARPRTRGVFRTLRAGMRPHTLEGPGFGQYAQGAPTRAGFCHSINRLAQGTLVYAQGAPCARWGGRVLS